jgi:hypothetical protein
MYCTDKPPLNMSNTAVQQKNTDIPHQPVSIPPASVQPVIIKPTVKTTQQQHIIKPTAMQSMTYSDGINEIFQTYVIYLYIHLLYVLI